MADDSVEDMRQEASAGGDAVRSLAFLPIRYRDSARERLLAMAADDPRAGKST